jgi:hypothetical protein
MAELRPDPSPGSSGDIAAADPGNPPAPGASPPVVLPPRPEPPSIAVVRAELGIPPGTPGGRKRVQRRRAKAPSYAAYLAALEAWERAAALVAPQRDAEMAARMAELEVERLRGLARQRERLDALLLAWTACTNRWRRQRALCRGLLGSRAWPSATVVREVARLAVEVTATALLRAGWQMDHRSESGSIYLARVLPEPVGRLRLRISDHALGYADAGTRRQWHDGPELILDPVEAPGDLVQWGREALAEWLEGRDLPALADEDASTSPPPSAQQRRSTTSPQAAHSP